MTTTGQCSVSQSDKLQLLADKLIDGWDPPAHMCQPCDDLKAKIHRRVQVSASSLNGARGHGKTELDSHANMCVVGKNCLIISRSGRVVDVGTFAEEAGSLNEVPLVDAMIAYECRKTGKVYLLILRNALYVESMDDNLISPFILREAGLIVNEKAKQHCLPGELTDDDHTIQDPESGMRIVMEIRSTFSVFDTRIPSEEDIEDGIAVIITPDGEIWDPYDSAFAENEAALLDWKGEVPFSTYEKKNLLEGSNLASIEYSIAGCEVRDRHDADVMIAVTEAQDVECISIAERDYVRTTSEVAANAIKLCSIDVEPMYAPMPACDDEVQHVLSAVSNTLDSTSFADALSNEAAVSKLKCSLGATSASPPDTVDDLWDETDPWHVTIDLNDLEGSLKMLQSEVGATAGRAKGVTPEHLSKIWQIDIEAARRTIGLTSQHVKHQEGDHLTRRYSTNDRMLRYKRIRTHFFTDTFHVTAKAVSSRKNKHMQLFVSDTGFMYVYPMESKSQIPDAVKAFAKEIGVPLSFILDPSGEQKSDKLKKITSEMGCSLKFLERATQWANLAELYIGILKEAVRKDLKDSDSPLKFWDYCAERRVKINNLTAKGLFQLNGSNPQQLITGEPGDISNLCQFGWFEWVYYKDAAPFPYQNEKLGRCLGPAISYSNEMSQWILKDTMEITASHTVRRLTDLEYRDPTLQRERNVFMDKCRKRYGDKLTVSDDTRPTSDALSSGADDVVMSDGATTSEPMSNPSGELRSEPNDAPYYEPSHIPEQDAVDANGKPIDNLDHILDTYINMEVRLPRGEEKELYGKVIGLCLDQNGKVIGQPHQNPVLNTLMYEVKFEDGTSQAYAANQIAENMWRSVNDEGYHQDTLESILDIRFQKNAVKDGFVYDRNGQRRLRKTTRGVDLKVAIRMGEDSPLGKATKVVEQWVPLKDMKASYPVEVAEYAVAHKLDKLPAFAWWVNYTLKKRDSIIASTKARIERKTHKYGIEIPRSVSHAIELDTRNGNTLWQDAYKKEMKNVGVAFDILPLGDKAPVGWTKATVHLVWDIKMCFTRKCRLVKDGHKTADSVGSNYSGVVSRDSVRIAFTYAALNDLNVCACDIRNAFIQAPSSEKHYIICGPEFGDRAGCVALIRRALYGGKMSGRDYWLHLRSCMEFLGFESCKADPDIWMRRSKRSDGTEYYTYVLLYVDDAIAVAETPEAILRNEIGKYFQLKEGSVGPPDIYLGGKCSKVTLDTGVECWSFSSSQYVQEACRNVRNYLKELNGDRPDHTCTYSMPKKAGAPLRTNYRPEIDQSDELEPGLAGYYQSLIGILRWMVELGRVDICY